MPLPRDVENLADDPNLQNPLQRSERMSTSWFGVSAGHMHSLASSSELINSAVPAMCILANFLKSMSVKLFASVQLFSSDILS